MKTKDELLDDLMELAHVRKLFIEGVETAFNILDVDEDSAEEIREVFLLPENVDEFVSAMHDVYGNVYDEAELAGLCNLYAEYPNMAAKLLDCTNQCAAVGAELGQKWMVRSKTH